MRFLQELHDIIQGTYLRSFSTSIVVEDYKALTDEEKYVFGSPHVCAAINCMKQMGMWANEQLLREPFLYVFEKGTIYDKELNRLFNLELTDEQRAYYRVESFAFGTKDRMPPLQAADILAYETRKEVTRRMDTQKSREARKSIKNLNVPLLDQWLYMNEAEFRKILATPHVKKVVESAEFKASANAHKHRFMI